MVKMFSVFSFQEGFKEFESKLQACAARLKGESLIQQAKSVNENSIKEVRKLKNIVDAKKEQKAASIEAMQALMKKDRGSFDEMIGSLKRAKTLMAGVKRKNTRQIEDFEKGVKKGTAEDVAHSEFILNVEDCTRDTLVTQINEIRSAFKKWSENQKYDSDVDMFVSDVEGIPLWEEKGLSKEEYDWTLDPHAYLTSDYLAIVPLVLGGCAGGAVAGAAGVSKCFSDM